MEEWQKEWNNAIKTIAADAEQFWHEMATEVDQFITEVAESLETLAQEVQTVFSSDFDDAVQELQELFQVEFWLEGGSTIEEDSLFSYFVETVEPDQERHPACIGCQHYHGQVYNGNLLVCGMHPYGWDDEQCPDWEADRLDHD